MKSVAWACLLLLVTAATADARMRRPRPIQVRMIAYVGEMVEGTRPDFTWVVSYRGKRRTLYVLKLDVLTGSITPLDIDAAARMYTVKFQIAGDKSGGCRLRDRGRGSSEDRRRHQRRGAELGRYRCSPE